MTENSRNIGNSGLTEEQAVDRARAFISEHYGKALTRQAESSWGAEYFRGRFGMEERGNELGDAWEALKEKGMAGADRLQEFLIMHCTQAEAKSLTPLDRRTFTDISSGGGKVGNCPQCFLAVKILEADGSQTCEACGYRSGDTVRIPSCISFEAEGTE